MGATFSVAALLAIFFFFLAFLGAFLVGLAAGSACAGLAAAGGLAGALAGSVAQAGAAKIKADNNNRFFIFMVMLPLWLVVVGAQFIAR